MQNNEAEISGQKARMKVFLSGSIRGGRQLLPVYRCIYDTLTGSGVEVLSWHVVDPELENKEAAMTEREIYARDMGLLAKSDVLVAEVTIPSIGVGYELCRAFERKIPVLCLYREGTQVSSMVLGNPYPKLIVSPYSCEEELKKVLLEFVNSAC